MAAKLKVFVSSDGLTDYVVAATSRPKALAAWGSRQDLFKSGMAHESDDAALAKAARARPGEVLTRPAGSRATLAKLKPVKAAPVRKGPSKVALKKVAGLEARLVEAEAQEARELAALDARRAKAQARHALARERLETALRAARQALE